MANRRCFGLRSFNKIKKTVGISKLKMNHIHSTISYISWQLRLNALIKALLLALTICLMLVLTGIPLWMNIGIGVLAWISSSFALGAFHNKYSEALKVLHKSSHNLEYSLELLNKPQLTIAEQLQLERLNQAQAISAPFLLHKRVLPFVLGFLIALIAYILIPLIPATSTPSPQQEPQTATALPTTGTETVAPALKSVEVKIQPQLIPGSQKPKLKI